MPRTSSGLRTLTGTITLSAAGSSPRREQIGADAAGDGRENDVVDGRAVCVPDRPQVLEGTLRPRQAAQRGELRVEDTRRRRSQQLVERADGAQRADGGLARGGAGRTRSTQRPLQQVELLAQEVAHATREYPLAARLGLGARAPAHGLVLGGLRRGVEQQRGELYGGETVDHAVV